MWDLVIKVKKEFVLRKGKIYPLSREEREEVCELINKQLRKEYIRLSKLSQTTPVFFVEKKDSKKYMIQDYIVVATTRHSRTNDLTSSKAL